MAQQAFPTPPARVTPAITLAELQDGCLILALLLYAFLSDPTPDQPGYVEALIGFLLVTYVGVQWAITVGTGMLLGKAGSTLMEIVGSLAFVYLLWIPLFVGVVNGWDPVDIVRDVIPLVYIFIPLIFYRRMMDSRWPWATLILPGMFAMIGVIFSVRYLVLVGASLTEIGSFMFYAPGKLYLTSDPTVLFAAIFLPLTAVQIWHFSRPLRYPLFLLVFGAGVIALATLAATGYRGPVGFVVISFIVFFLVRFRKLKLNVVLGIILFSAFTYVYYDQISGVIDLLLRKHEHAGLNIKVREFFAVINETSSSVGALIVGKGWGALYVSPAYPTIKIRFTHMILSYAMLKTGVLGTFFMFMYGVSFLGYARRISKFDLALFLAIGAPIINGILLQPTFKYLTFGLLLTLLAVAGSSERRVRAQDGVKCQSSGTCGAPWSRPESQ